MEKLETTAKLKIASFRFKHSLLKKQNRQKTIYARKINICRRRFLKVDDGDVSFYLIFIDRSYIHASVLKEQISLMTDRLSSCPCLATQCTTFIPISA